MHSIADHISKTPVLLQDMCPLNDCWKLNVGCCCLQIEAWLSRCGICIPLYQYSMTRYHDNFMQWYHERAAHEMAPGIRQAASMSAAGEPAGAGASRAGHDCQVATEAAAGDSAKVPSQCALAAAARASATDRANAAADSASADATQEAAADATEGADLSADSVMEDRESASPVPAVTWERSEPMLSDSALEEAAGADLEETADPELAQIVDELIAATVAQLCALDDGASSRPADPALAVLDAAPANVHDSFTDPTHGAAESSGISPAPLVAVAAGTGFVCRPDGAIHGSSATSIRPLPPSDLTVSPLSAEGCYTVAAYSAEAHSAEAQNAKGQAAQGHSADAHSTDAAQNADAQDADAHSAEAYTAGGQGAHAQTAQHQRAHARSTEAQSAAAHKADAQTADAQDAEDQGADAHNTQTQPAEATSAEAIKAEAADAEAHSLADETAQAYSAEAYSADTDTAAACTAQVRFAAVQLLEPDDSAVAADITAALSASLPVASSTDNSVAATVQAVTIAAPEDAAPSDTAETQPQARQLADLQPTESGPIELSQTPEVTHSAAESAENSLHSDVGQPQTALSLRRPQLQLQFMHEREAIREREMEQMRQHVTEVEDACKVAVEREVGFRQDQIARLQGGKQDCYGPPG